MVSEKGTLKLPNQLPRGGAASLVEIGFTTDGTTGEDWVTTREIVAEERMQIVIPVQRVRASPDETPSLSARVMEELRCHLLENLVPLVALVCLLQNWITAREAFIL